MIQAKKNESAEKPACKTCCQPLTFAPIGRTLLAEVPNVPTHTLRIRTVVLTGRPLSKHDRPILERLFRWLRITLSVEIVGVGTPRAQFDPYYRSPN